MDIITGFTALIGFVLGVSQNATWDVVKWTVSKFQRVNYEEVLLDVFQSSVRDYSSRADVYASGKANELLRKVQDSPSELLRMLNVVDYPSFAEFFSAIHSQAYQESIAHHLKTYYFPDTPAHLEEVFTQIIVNVITTYRVTVLFSISNDDALRLVLQETVKIESILQDLAAISTTQDDVKDQLQQVSKLLQQLNIDNRTNFPFMVPLLPVQGVLGRDDILSTILSLLEPENDDATNVSAVALQGMGGIGKTTLAIALGRATDVPRFFPDGVLWTSLGPNPTIRHQLEGWGQALGVNMQAERNEDACYNRLLNTLHNRRVLLIIDDVWDIHHGKYFTLGGSQSRTLLTTRELPIANHFATPNRVLIVDMLKPEPALALLNNLVPKVVASDKNNAIRLCESLEFHPLALTLAGRFLANEANVTSRMRRLLDELIERRESRLSLLQEEGRLGIDEDNPVSLQAILGMSVDRLDKIDKERFAMLSEFGAEPLTWEVDAVASVWECSLEDAEITVSQFVKRGLVTVHSSSEYWMHALLADYAAEMSKEMQL